MPLMAPAVEIPGWRDLEYNAHLISINLDTVTNESDLHPEFGSGSFGLDWGSQVFTRQPEDNVNHLTQREQAVV
jgi:hypothetical protein